LPAKDLRKLRKGKTCELANISRRILLSFELVNSARFFMVS